MRVRNAGILLMVSFLSLADLGQSALAHDPDQEESVADFIPEDLELWLKSDDGNAATGCTAASKAQLAIVNAGNLKRERFLARCRSETKDSPWCDQLVRPNPESYPTFVCTYSESQPHSLIHPTESTWTHAIKAVKLVQELEQKGLKVCLIYNWWRPEPYNQNVGGSPTRHPYGTSVDVRFCSNEDADRAFDELCKYRRQGRIRAIGHYGTSALHFGIGDSRGNTWGRSCP